MRSSNSPSQPQLNSTQNQSNVINKNQNDVDGRVMSKQYEEAYQPLKKHMNKGWAGVGLWKK
jgi:hypothetical protein